MTNLNLTARFGIDGRGFKSGLDKAENQVNQFSKRILGIFAGIVSFNAMANLANDTFEWAERMTTLSEQTQMSIKDLQGLESAARQTNVPFESLVKSFEELGKSRFEAMLNPNSKKGKILDLLGFDQKALRNVKDMRTFFFDVAEVIRTTDLGANQASVVREIFAESGNNIIPLINAGIRNMVANSAELGQVWSDGFVKEISDAKKEMAALNAEIKIGTGMLLKESGAVGTLSKALKFVRMALFAQRNPNASIMDKDKFFKQVWGASPIDAILSQLKPLAVDAAKGLLGIVDVDKKKDFQQRLDDVFAPKETVKAEMNFRKLQASDQLARIGGFTGAESKTVSLAQKNNKTLEQIRRALEVNGIVIKGV